MQIETLAYVGFHLYRSFQICTVGGVKVAILTVFSVVGMLCVGKGRTD